MSACQTIVTLRFEVPRCQRRSDLNSIW